MNNNEFCENAKHNDQLFCRLIKAAIESISVSNEERKHYFQRLMDLIEKKDDEAR